MNSGSAVDDVDCGDGVDTIHINPPGAPGGRSNADAIAQGRIKNCENIVTAAVLADPAKGISWSGGGAKNGTERNDTLLGNHRNNRLFGLAGDDVIWGDSVHSAGGTKARDELDGGPGNDTIYGGRGANVDPRRRRRRHAAVGVGHDRRRRRATTRSACSGP